MQERPTATVIPFPSRSFVPRPPPVPATRLSEALSSLSDALADQRNAVAEWRSAAHDLATNMQVLSTSLAAAKRR